MIDVIYTSLSPTEIIPYYGHVIFFPNGGYHPQPGVPKLSPEASSIRSVEYWAESVHIQDAFWSLRCNNWKEFSVGTCPKSRALSVMGEYISPRYTSWKFLNFCDIDCSGLTTSFFGCVLEQGDFSIWQRITEHRTAWENIVLYYLLMLIWISTVLIMTTDPFPLDFQSLRFTYIANFDWPNRTKILDRMRVVV